MSYRIGDLPLVFGVAIPLSGVGVSALHIVRAYNEQNPLAGTVATLWVVLSLLAVVVMTFGTHRVRGKVTAGKIVDREIHAIYGDDNGRVRRVEYYFVLEAQDGRRGRIEVSETEFNDSQYATDSATYKGTMTTA